MLVGEKICEAFARKSDIQAASLGFSGIYTESHRVLLLERRKNPAIRGIGALWSYIDATPRELVSLQLPQVKDLREGLGGRCSGYGVVQASTGFEAKFLLDG